LEEEVKKVEKDFSQNIYLNAKEKVFVDYGIMNEF